MSGQPTSPFAAARIQHPYCLKCYAPLERNHDACTVCPHCHFVSVAADHGRYWTREPNLVELEWFAKVFIVLGLAAFFAWMLTRMNMQFGMGQGFAIGAFIAVGAVLWETASKLTRHKPYFRARLFWTALILVLGSPFFLGGVWPNTDAGWVGRAAILSVAAVFALGAWSVYRLGARLERWKLTHIANGQRRASA